MKLEIVCPECANASRIDYVKVPSGKLRTTCNKCQHQFVVEKEKRTNCRILKGKQAGKIYPENGWKVEHPACQGMTYDLEAVEGLVRSGMVSQRTRICPPGERAFFEAGSLTQLEKALDQWQSKNRGRK